MPLRRIDRWLAPAPDAARVGWLGGQPYAHRGLHGAGLPENSLAAFSAAIESGMGLECDVQLSADGQPMVFHDWELDRLTDESGAVATRTAEELAGMTLLDTEQRIPSLSDWLHLVGGRVPLLIEVKSRREAYVPAICRAVEAALQGYDGPHAVMSFDPRVGRWFARNSPQTLRGLVMTEEDDRGLSGILRRHLWLWIARPDFLAYDIRDLPSRFAAAQRARGLPLLSWTVKSAELRERAARYADAPIAEGDGVAKQGA